MEILSAKDLQFSYEEGKQVIKNLNLTVEKGEYLAIIGHNGSGKSTLAKLFNGLLSPDGGEIIVDNLTFNKKNLFEIRKKVGVVFQNPDNQLIASIVEDDVAFGPENLGIDREEIGKRIEYALNAVNMQAFRKSSPERLSGGQKQRIAIAGVLALKPEILILDESTSMLDPMGRQEILSVVKKLNEEGTTVITITHYMDEVLSADRVVVMNKGEIAMIGAPKEIFASVDKIKSYGLELPLPAYIADRLKKEGVKIQDTVMDRLDLLACLKKLPLKTCASEKLQEKLQEKEKLVSVKNLSYTYSKGSKSLAVKAIKDISLDIYDRDFFGIVGQTGSGKSTFIQHLNGLIKLQKNSGEITVKDFNLAHKKCDYIALRSKIGMVFQYPEYQLFADTVFDDVAFGLKNFNKNIFNEEINARVADALTLVGFEYSEIKDKSPFELSGGQKRRVAIAGVIVTRPEILILDEPAAGLDPRGKREFLAMLKNLHNSFVKTIIIVSHDMDLISEHCNKVALFKGGEIITSGTPEEVFKNEEILTSCGLELPLTAFIRKELNKSGVNLHGDLTVDNFISQIKKSGVEL